MSTTKDSLKERVHSGTTRFEFDGLIQGATPTPEAVTDTLSACPDATLGNRELLHTGVPSHSSLPLQSTAPLHATEHSSVGFLANQRPARNGLRMRSLLFAIGICVFSLVWWKGLPALRVRLGQNTAGASSAKLNAWAIRGLPDPTLTPGEAKAGAVIALPIADSVRQEVFHAYGIAPEDSRYVLCRLIPGELGGTNGAKNLFPVTPWFANLKQRLDGYLEVQVHNHQVTAKQAQRELTDNWVEAVHGHYLRNYGLKDTAKAKQKEDALHW
jgi:hypothetical protein